MYRNSATIFTGDLNCKNLAWGSNSTDTPGSDLLDVLDDQNWIVLNDGSKTRIDPRNGKEEVLALIIGNTAATSMKPEFFGNFANEQRNNAHKRVSITTKMEANTLFDIKTFNLLYISHHFTLTKHYQYCE